MTKKIKVVAIALIAVIVIYFFAFGVYITYISRASNYIGIANRQFQLAKMYYYYNEPSKSDSCMKESNASEQTATNAIKTYKKINKWFFFNKL